MLKHTVLLDSATIATRVAAIAKAVRTDTRCARVTVVGLLTGSFVFVADLIRALAAEGMETRVDFIAVSHYGPTGQPAGPVQIRKDLSIDIRGQEVLLVDDILDTGLTLRCVQDRLALREPHSVRTCVLLDKPERRVTPIEVDYVGFVIPDRWVIGYGLDLDGQGRELPYVGAVDAAPLPAREGGAT